MPLNGYFCINHSLLVIIQTPQYLILNCLRAIIATGVAIMQCAKVSAQMPVGFIDWMNTFRMFELLTCSQVDGTFSRTLQHSNKDTPLTIHSLHYLPPVVFCCNALGWKGWNEGLIWASQFWNAMKTQLANQNCEAHLDQPTNWINRVWIMTSWLFKQRPKYFDKEEMAIDVMYILIYFFDDNASVERWGDECKKQFFAITLFHLHIASMMSLTQGLHFHQCATLHERRMQEVHG